MKINLILFYIFISHFDYLICIDFCNFKHKDDLIHGTFDYYGIICLVRNINNTNYLWSFSDKSLSLIEVGEKYFEQLPKFTGFVITRFNCDACSKYNNLFFMFYKNENGSSFHVVKFFRKTQPDRNIPWGLKSSGSITDWKFPGTNSSSQLKAIVFTRHNNKTFTLVAIVDDKLYYTLIKIDSLKWKTYTTNEYVPFSKATGGFNRRSESFLVIDSWIYKIKFDKNFSSLNLTKLKSVWEYFLCPDLNQTLVRQTTVGQTTTDKIIDIGQTKADINISIYLVIGVIIVVLIVFFCTANVIIFCKKKEPSSTSVTTSQVQSKSSFIKE